MEMLQFKDRILHLLEEVILFLRHVWGVSRILTTSLWGLRGCPPPVILKKGMITLFALSRKTMSLIEKLYS